MKTMISLLAFSLGLFSISSLIAILIVGLPPNTGLRNVISIDGKNTFYEDNYEVTKNFEPGDTLVIEQTGVEKSKVIYINAEWHIMSRYHLQKLRHGTDKNGNYFYQKLAVISG